MVRTSLIFLLLPSCLFISCRAYHQNILFRTDTTANRMSLVHQKDLAEKNYKIQVDDKLKIRVYTNEGERMIDPDYELMKSIQNTTLAREDKEYLVLPDGTVKFPMVGQVPLQGLTLHEAEQVLEKRYANFYKEPFVTLEFTNKRVIVLGATGGQVIPLKNENMNLIEVLALAGGLNNNAKGYNIRLIRGDLKNPEVQVIDLSTIEGMKKASLQVYPGDIVYVEPVRRVISESFTEVGPYISLFLSAITLLYLIRSLH